METVSSFTPNFSFIHTFSICWMPPYTQAYLYKMVEFVDSIWTYPYRKLSLYFRLTISKMDGRPSSWTWTLASFPLSIFPKLHKKFKQFGSILRPKSLRSAVKRESVTFLPLANSRDLKEMNGEFPSFKKTSYQV